MHRRAVAVGDDQIAVVGAALLIWSLDSDLEALVALIDVALGAVGVGGGDRRAHILQADAIAVELVGLQFHAHRRQGAAAERDLADAVDLRQLLLQHRIGAVVKLRRVSVSEVRARIMMGESAGLYSR